MKRLFRKRVHRTVPETQRFWNGQSVRCLLMIMHFTGLNPAVFSASVARNDFQSMFIKFRLIIWYFFSSFLFSSVVLYGVCDIYTMTKVYKDRLREVDFFMLTFAVYRLCFGLKCAFTIFLLSLRNNRFRKLLQKLDEVSTRYLPERGTQRISALLWKMLLFLSVVAVVKAVLVRESWRRIALQLLSQNLSEWDFPFDVLGLATIPFGVFATIYVIISVYTVVIEVLPGIFFIVTLTCLTESFITLNTSQPSGRMIPVKSVTTFQKEHLLLRNLVREMDKYQCDMSLLTFICDALGWISCISLAVRVLDSNRDGIDFISALELPFVYMIIITTLMMAMKTYCSIRLNSAAHQSETLLETLPMFQTGDLVKISISEFLHRLKEDPIVISIGNMVPLTKEFVLKVIALLVTYSTVVYQMMDQKRDFQRFLKKDDGGLLIVAEILNLLSNTVNRTNP